MNKEEIQKRMMDYADDHGHLATVPYREGERALVAELLDTTPERVHQRTFRHQHGRKRVKHKAWLVHHANGTKTFVPRSW